MGLEKQANMLHRSVKDAKEHIHLLKAEWAHLNDPRRLQALSGRFLTIGPIRASQIINPQILHGEPNQASDTSGYDLDALEELVATIGFREDAAPSKRRR